MNHLSRYYKVIASVGFVIIFLSILTKTATATSKQNLVFPSENHKSLKQNQQNSDDYLTTIPDDKRFINQEFSKQLFWHIPWWNNACPFYKLGDYCAYRRQHLFRNTTLIMEGVGTEYASATLNFNTPQSQEKALDYAKIISRGYMKLKKPTTRSRTQIVYDETDREFAAGSVCTLELDTSRKVTKITYLLVTP